MPNNSCKNQGLKYLVRRATPGLKLLESASFN